MIKANNYNMADIKEERIEIFKKEGFSFAALKHEVETNSIKVKQEENMSVKDRDEGDVSLVKNMTEADCDIAIAIKQETNLLETVSSTIKESVRGEDRNDNETSYIPIPETIEKIEFFEIESEENLNTPSTSSHDMLAEIGDQPHPNISCSLTPDNSSEKSVSGSDRQKRKRDSITLEKVTPQSSTEDAEQQKSRKKRQNVTDSSKKKQEGKKTALCPFCDKTLSKSYFPSHIRVHTDERPFKCIKCSYASHFKGTLDAHMQSHHPTQR